MRSMVVAIALQIAAAGTVSGVEDSSLRALVKLEQVMPTRLRQLQPHGLVHTGHHWYLVAWDPARTSCHARRPQAT